MSFKIAEAYVEIHADDSKLTGEVKESIDKTAKDSAGDADKGGSLIGRFFGTSFGSALRERFSASKQDTDGFFNNFKAKAMQAGSAGLNMVGSLSNAGTAIAAISTLSGFVLQLSGVLGLVPGAAAAGLAALVTYKLGAAGIKKAFEALNPTLDTLKSKVSGTFQTALAPAVNDLKVVLPQLTSHFQGMAKAISGVAVGFTSMLKEKSNVQSLNTVLDAGSRIVRNIGAALAPLGQVFLDVASVGSKVLADLTGNVGPLAQRFADFVRSAKESGQLQQWMQGGINALKQLFDELRGIGSLVATVFGAFQDAGVSSGNAVNASLSLLGLKLGGIPGMIIGSLIPAITEFGKTPAGHDMLVTLSQDLAQISSIVTTVLVAAFNAIAPALPGLLKAFTSLATTASDILVPALQFIGPPLQVIGDFIGSHTGLITGLAVAIGIWTAAQWLLNFALDANPIGLFVLAIGVLIAIVAVIIAYWGPISTFFANLWNSVASWFTSVWTSIWTWLTGVWTWIKDAAVTVWNAIKQFFIDWWPLILGIMTGGVGLIIGLVVKNWDTIKNTTISVFNAVRDFFVNIWNNIVGFVTGAANNIWTAVRNGVTNAYNAVVSGLTNAVNFVRGLPGQILAGLGNLGSLLWNAGASIINGLLAGLKSAWQAVTGFVSGIAGWIADHKGPISYDVQLLVPHGNAIMDGLTSGLEQGFGPVKSLVGDMAGQIASAFPNRIPTVGSGDLPSSSVAGSTGGGSGSLQTTQIGEVHLHVAGNLDPTDPVKWTAALKNIRDGIRTVERSYA